MRSVGAVRLYHCCVWTIAVTYLEQNALTIGVLLVAIAGVITTIVTYRRAAKVASRNTFRSAALEVVARARERRVALVERSEEYTPGIAKHGWVVSYLSTQSPGGPSNASVESALSAVVVQSTGDDRKAVKLLRDAFVRLVDAMMPMQITQTDAMIRALELWLEDGISLSALKAAVASANTNAAQSSAEWRDWFLEHEGK
jgi:sulfur relay (sulfurtransferase) DsrF/TusC family protein